MDDLEYIIIKGGIRPNEPRLLSEKSMNIKNIERDLFALEKKELTKQQEHNIHRVKEHAQHMLIILSKLKPSRELSLAKTKLEECVMWATKSIVFSEEK